MKTGRLIVVGSLLSILAATAARAQAPIAITNGGSLHFGDVIASGASGSVVMAPSGSRSASGGVVLGNAGFARASEFTVTGDADATYSITLPAAETLTGGAGSMTIDTFTHDATGVLTAGSETFRVGATLHVEASQASGSYSGTFSVTVVYD